MLEKYKKKRDFSKTKEPSGSKKKGLGMDLVFMIHKHHASHLHYDLRLELDGVLKSWAVPKGPSMDPKDKRLAMMVEDHPFEYKDYEGVIPEGEYGAGPTLIWDKGTYEPKEDQGSKKENEKRIREKIEKGHLSFILHGEKLHGRFDLIHIKDDKKDNVWLLSKAPDEYANMEIENEEISVVSGKTIEELRGDKPTKGEKREIESGKKGKIPKDVKPMLATLVERPFDREDWIFEIKWDGYRTIAEIEKGKVHLYSRNGVSFNKKFQEIAEELKDFPDAVLDGEIVAFNEEGRQDFGLLQNYESSGEGNLGFYVFDILYYDGKILSDLPLLERKEILKDVLYHMPQVKYTDHIEVHGEDFFKLAKKEKLEGIIAKNGKSKYQFGKRGTDWLKIKNILTQEAIIAGYTAPRGSREGFGALILGVYDKGVLKYIGHTGGGFDARLLASIKELLDQHKTEECPFQKVPQTNEKATWIKPKIVCEVKFQEWTRDGSLRQPVFLGLREDKEAREVVREEVEKITPKKETKKKKETVQENEKKLKLTNLQKIYFPEDKITKGDLIEYYRKISPHLLPFLKDRPETLVRYPNGIHAEGFYQKNVKDQDLPPWMKTQEVYSESDDRMTNYVVVGEEVESILFLINLGCIDLHPWSSRVGTLEYPDYIIFDFDPEDIGFKEVVKAALITHELLETIDAPHFCKTSGATGIHILVPTGAKYTYEQATTFAKLINTLVHARLPDTTSLERMPKNRQKRVYLDFLQNRKGQTIASVYSIRPRVGAPVSTPITWDELNTRLKPEKFNIKTIFKRLEKVGNLWEEFFKLELNMEESLGRLDQFLG